MSAAFVPVRPSRRRRPSSARSRDVRRLLQFTQGNSIDRAAGLMNRTSMLLSRSGPPDRTPWKTRSSGPSDFTTLYLRIALPALTSTVSPFSRWIRSTTQLFTPIVALEASLLGAPQSPRQNRSSIVTELAPISFQRKPASSLTLSPV